MLKDCRTKLKFDDYESEWVTIENGIRQGDPLSMILYLYYNTNLLDTATLKNQTAVTFVDNANLYMEGNTYEEVYSSINETGQSQGVDPDT